MSDPNERQIAGTHYQGKFQHWDFAIRVLNNRYLEGCATKYISRWRKKGEGLKDLKKSDHYLEKLIQSAYMGYVLPLGLEQRLSPVAAISSFCAYNDLNPEESGIVELISRWVVIADLEVARLRLANLIAEEQIVVDEIEAMRQENP